METTTTMLLDRWKAAKAHSSDNAAALALKVSRAAVSRWRHGLNHAEAETAAKMAEDCGLDVLAVLAAIEADRARSEGARRVWSRYGRGAFMALALAAGGAAGGPADAVAASHSRPLCEAGKSRFGSGGYRPRSDVRRSPRRRRRRYPVTAKAHP